MKTYSITTGLLLLVGAFASASAQEVKVTTDTIVVQAEAMHETDPDLATLAFQISVQEKQLRTAYGQATQSLRRIQELAERNGLAREDVSSSRFTVLPLYNWNDKKRRIQAYRVESSVLLRVRDFSKVAALIDESVQEGLVEFRSLTYSLADEEAAKQRAVAEATRRAEARAKAALEAGSRRLGPLRYATVDVKQIAAIARLEPVRPVDEVIQVESGFFSQRAVARPAPATPPMPSPEKVTVRAAVQCIFQLQ